MKLKYIFIQLAALTATTFSLAQSSDKHAFPELVITDIPGAPKLSSPVLIEGSNSAIVTQGQGIIAPAVWDWDDDGLSDLLVGEFGSGAEFGRHVGSFIRVYQNKGTKTSPQFTGQFDYARPPFEFKSLTYGTPYSTDQYCCIGFTPQFIDLNNDGFVDMISGQYQGEVMWFRGSEKGFLPSEPLKQDGDPRGSDYVKNQFYWLFSSASFGDFTGDGLADLIVGGRSLRISKNIGTKDRPEFAKRELLLDINGNPLRAYQYTHEELEEKKKWEELTRDPVPSAGDYDLSPYVVDWNNDGVLDLLVTNSYTHKGLAVVSFFKGVVKSGEHRFQPEIPLFTTKDGSKAFPGSGPRIFVTDWNNDGINDLLVGTSIITVEGKFHQGLSWIWEKDTGLKPAGKDPANLLNIPENILQNYKQQVKLPEGISIEEYMTIRHQGYVYLMLGGAEKAIPLKAKKKW